jgi:hypothetical protein
MKNQVFFVQVLNPIWALEVRIDQLVFFVCIHLRSSGSLWFYTSWQIVVYLIT